MPRHPALIAGWLAVVAWACLSCPPMARAQNVIDVDTAFSGTISEGDAVNLFYNGTPPGGYVDGDVTNDGQLWFNNEYLTSQTVPYSISGTGLVVLWQPVTLTFTGTNTYGGGTLVYGGTMAIAAGGSIYHPSGDFEIEGVAGTLLSVSGSLTNANANLGVTAGTFADATVASGGSWTSLGTLNVGVGGASSLTISGGTASATDAYFGYNVGSSGTFTMSDGMLQTSGAMYFGYFGDSTFAVTGGTLSAGSNLYVSYGPGAASGTLTSGTITVSNTLFVGNKGFGNLSLNGGYVATNDAVFGQSTDGIGLVTVNSGTLAVANTLEVGSTTGGQGTLAISGGAVTSSFGVIGNLAGSQGVVQLSAGSLTLSGTNPDGNLQVGYLGTGLLDITGGSLSASGGNIGWGATGSGTVAMSSGSLSVTGEFNIGRSGTGALFLTGGLLSTDQVILGKGNFLGVIGSGTAVVTGGTWNNALSLSIGQFGNGDMSVSGGYVSAASGYISAANGLATTGVGNLTVTGGTVAFAGDLSVGNAYPGSSGSGTLTVSGSSGFVSVDGTLTRAANGSINLNSGGTLSIGTGGATGALATDIANNGLLIFNRSTDYTYANVISGSGAVTKRGTATLTFTSTSSYVGATSIESGTFVLAGALGQTEMTVASGATLAGDGTTLGGVSISGGGTVTPGDQSIATLEVGGLTFSGSTATAVIQITGSGLGEYDQIVAADGSAAALEWGSGTLHLVMSGTPAYATNTLFQLFDGFASYTGNVSGIEFSAAGTDYAGLTFAETSTAGVWQTGWTSENQSLFFYASTGELVVVPEPSTLAMGAAGLVAFRLYRRRRNRGRIC